MSGFNINARLQSYQSTQHSIDLANRTQPATSSSSSYNSSSSASIQAYNPIRYEDAMFKVLSALPDLLAAEYSSGDWQDLEVEIRLGMIVEGSRRMNARIHDKVAFLVTDTIRESRRTKFHAGIDESFAKNMKNILSNKRFFESIIRPVQRVLCTESGDRYEVIREDVENQKLYLTKESKSKVTDHPLALLSHDYDIRICCAKELKDTSKVFEVDRETLQGRDGIRFTMERRKRRTTFHQKTTMGKIWKVDYTEVQVRHFATASTAVSLPMIDYELEFELEDKVKMAWFAEKNEQEKMKHCTMITSALLSLVNICIPSLSSHDGGEFKAQSIPSNQNRSVLEQIINLNKLFIATESKNVSFVGSMPINMFRSSLNKVLTTDYFVGEKSDGVRYLMYVMHISDSIGRDAVLINRSGECCYFPGSKGIAMMLEKDCILDGEIVYNLEMKKYVYVIFDILCWDRVSCMQKVFSDRMQLVDEEVMSRVERSSAGGKDDVELLKKHFVPKQQISQLIRNFRTEANGEKVYKEVYGSTIFHHYTDGIIFQPNTPYVISKYYDLLKWKWADMRSVDLAVSIMLDKNQKLENIENQYDHLINERDTVTKDHVVLWCAGPGSAAHDRPSRVNFTKRGESNVSLGKFDTFRLLAEYDYYRKNFPQVKDGNVIAEVAYDTKVGMWTYSKIREDKKISNFIDSVIGVFTEQAEAISLEELEYSILASCAEMEQDFESLMDTVRDEIIIQQRKRVKLT